RLIACRPASRSRARFLCRRSLFGAGFGFFQVPSNRAVMNSGPRARSGVGGGMLSAARLLGQTLGAAGVAILFRAYGAAGSNFALCLAALLALAGAGVSVVRLSARPTEETP